MEEQSADQRVMRQMIGDHMVIATLARAIGEKYGNEGLSVLAAAMKEASLRAMARNARKAGCRVGDGTIEDWIRLEEFNCNQIPGIKWEVQYTPDRGVMRVTYCPMAEAYKTIYPDGCPKMLIGTEQAIAETINPNLQVRGDCYIPLGAPTCDIVCEWKPGTKP